MCPLVRLEMLRLEIPRKILVMKIMAIPLVMVFPEKLARRTLLIYPPPVPLGIFGIYPDIGTGRCPGRHRIKPPVDENPEFGVGKPAGNRSAVD